MNEEKKRLASIANIILPHEDHEIFYFLQKGKNIFGKLLQRSNNSNRSNNIIKNKEVSWYRHTIFAFRDYKGIKNHKEINFPVICFHGEKDKLLSIESAEKYKIIFPAMNLIIIKNGRHQMAYSITDKIIGFLRPFLESPELDY